MSKTYNKHGKTCDICGAKPAYYSKLAKKTLCGKHLHKAIMKYLIATATIVIGILILTM